MNQYFGMRFVCSGCGEIIFDATMWADDSGFFCERCAPDTDVTEIARLKKEVVRLRKALIAIAALACETKQVGCACVTCGARKALAGD